VRHGVESAQDGRARGGDARYSLKGCIGKRQTEVGPIERQRREQADDCPARNGHRKALANAEPFREIAVDDCEQAADEDRQKAAMHKDMRIGTVVQEIDFGRHEHRHPEDDEQNTDGESDNAEVQILNS